MGQIDRAIIVAKLREVNPSSRRDSIEMYAAAFCQWQEASENIAVNGTICAHPRTGAPIENPYLKIQTMAMRNMQQFDRLKTDCLWPSTP